jgi:rRNA processing protein Krr1/Pno1
LIIFILSFPFYFYIIFQEMDIYQRQTGRVLGPQGSTIKEMQARFGVKLNITVSDSAKGGEEGAINKLRMTGSIDAVRAVRQCVEHICNGGLLEQFQSPYMQGGGGQMVCRER